VQHTIALVGLDDSGVNSIGPGLFGWRPVAWILQWALLWVWIFHQRSPFNDSLRLRRCPPMPPSECLIFPQRCGWRLAFRVQVRRGSKKLGDLGGKMGQNVRQVLESSHWAEANYTKQPQVNW